MKSSNLAIVPKSRPVSHQTEIDELRERLAELAKADRDAWLKALDALHDLSLRIADDPNHPVGIRQLAAVLGRRMEETSLTAAAIAQRAK